MSLILQAFYIAQEAHRGQVRKYTFEPYIHHPVRVARIVSSVTDDAEMLAAALLHDTVEDTPVTLDQVRERFGSRVAAMVEGLTNVSRPQDGNRAARRALDRAHSAAACPEAQTIKLADLIDNTGTIAQLDPEFARVYLAEKRLLLGVLKKGDRRLWLRADAICSRWERNSSQA